MNPISPSAQINKLHPKKEGKHYKKMKRYRKIIEKSNKWGFLWSQVTMVQESFSIQWSFLKNCSRHHIYLAGLELGVPGGVCTLLSFGMSPWHPYIPEVPQLSGCLWDFPSSWMWPKAAACALCCGRRRQGGVKELCQHQWEWPAPLLPPLTPLLASSNLLPLWPGSFLQESPSWHMAGIQAQSGLVNQHVWYISMHIFICIHWAL